MRILGLMVQALPLCQLRIQVLVVTIVREKELRLREGMHILGLTVQALPLCLLRAQESV